MKIDGDITILVNDNGATIEITDRNANTTFAKAELTAKQWCQALSRLGHTRCKLNVYGLDNVGKKHERKDFEFELPESLQDWDRDHELVADYAGKHAPKGWKADRYFGSQTSFFDKDGRRWARCSIRRWI